MKPFVYAVANYKGGVGKSTIAMHLAAHLKATLVDLDRNGDSYRFAKGLGLEGFHCFTDTPEVVYDLIEDLKAKGKRVVVDCPPGESALTRIAMLEADMVVAPTRPGPLDLFALGRVTTGAREANEARGKVPLLFVCNFYRNTEIAKMFVEALQNSKVGSYVGKLWERKEYAECIAMSQPVWTFAPKSTGAKEMFNLVEFLGKAGAHA